MTQADSNGFRPLFTEAPVARRLLTTPSAYDAAPTWLVREASEASTEVRRSVAKALSEHTTPDTSDLKHQAMLAVQLVAPIGLNIVRVFGLGAQMASLAVNPVAALLSAPALFFTGKRMARDLRRALLTDPKVRSLMERADEWMAREQPLRAAEVLREALDQDLHPEYARNGDLYLKLGVAWMAAQRPRLAMVAFARASVLFDPDATVPIAHKDETVQVNKRGLTEMMALAALDSFARDDKGLSEWSELGEDFGRVARRLLDQTADRQQAGRLWGAFGTDEASAQACRELSAKVGFLVAKLKLASDPDGSAEAFDRALEELQGAAIESEELHTALLEQATYYCGRAMGEPAGPAAHRATRLLRAAAESASGPQGVLVEAQAARFTVRVLEAGAGAGPDGDRLREELGATLQRLEEASSDAVVRSVPMGGHLEGWTAEQQYRLATDRDSRRRHIQQAYAAWMQAEEPVSAMRAALRLAWASDDKAGMGEALSLLEAAARRIQESDPDAVSTAFAARALLDVAQLSGEATLPRDARNRCAELFLEAAQEVEAKRTVVPFYVGDKLVLHEPQQARLVLLGIAAHELARAESLLPALSLLAEVRHHMEGRDEAPVQLALDLERAALLQAAGELEESQDLLQEIEKEARIIGSSELQRRALELLHQGRRGGQGAEEGSSDPTESVEPVELSEDDSLVDLDDESPLEDYARLRQELLRRGREVVDILSEAGLADRLTAGDHRLVDTLAQRLQRIEDAKFRIAIAGEFSAGKSTLLNALLREHLLPVSVRPTTAVINRLQWSAEPFTRVHFEDGRSETIEARALRGYVTEKGNPSNERKVSEVIVGRPIELLRHGAEIIDTPGLSSMVEAHAASTRALLPTLDALVLVATARQPFGASTGRFLDEAGLALDNKVFYVLNKRDQVATRGLAESIAYAQHEVGERVRGSKVLPVSAYARLAAIQFAAGDIDEDDLEDDPRVPDSVRPDQLEASSGVGELEAELGAFLREARGLPMLRDCARRTLDILDEGELALSNELAAAKLSAVELRKAFETLSAEHAQRKAEAQEKLDLLERTLEDGLARIVRNTAAGIPQLREAILRSAPVSSGDLAGEEEAAAYGQRLRSAVQHHVDHHLRGATNELSRVITAHRVDARTALRALQRELRSTFAKELKAPVVPDAASLSLDPSSLEVGGNALVEIGGTMALSGIIGFIGGLLGPVGWLLGTVGGTVAAMWLDDVKTKAASKKVEDSLSVQLDKLADEVRQSMTAACAKARAASTDEVGRHRDELLAEFDASLASLLDSRMLDDDAIRMRQATLRGLQHRARSCRKGLNRVAHAT